MKKLNLNNVFGDETLDFECPACKHTFKVKFSNISKDGSLVTCPACNQDINVIHDETTKKTVRNISDGLEKFNKSLKRLNKFK